MREKTVGNEKEKKPEKRVNDILRSKTNENRTGIKKK